MNQVKVVFAVLICVLLIEISFSGCSKSAPIPDVDFLGNVSAISREEGSGTRSEFETLIKTNSRGSVQIASSTEEMIQMTADAPNRIGYLAYSSVKDNTQVKTISVDGIAPDMKTIQNGKYPLCRSYFLAYSGELSALESDFLTYILSAGQDIVENYAMTVKKSGTFLSDRSEGTIRISGSSSVAPILAALTEDYKTYNPNAAIEITVTDSTEGLTSAIRGECDMAMSSRDLKSYEEELLTKRAIARDAIAVIVNQENPITDLSIDQIGKLYNKECEDWQDLK